MRLTSIPRKVDRSYGFPITHDALRSEFGSVSLDVPDGPDQSLATLLDTCSDCGFEETYRTAADLRTTLLCCADGVHVGRAGYDDRGGNPGRAEQEQVSF